MKHLKWFVTLVSVIAVAAALIFVVSCKKDSTSSSNNSTPEWTVIVYGAGNNNLDGANANTSYIVQDVQDMEKVGSQSGMNIVAMISSLRLAGGAKYYKVEKFPNENPGVLSSPVLENKGSKDMSDQATLVEFLNYAKANYPARHYLLLIDDHGAGWPGSCTDDLGGTGAILTMTELKNAISTSNIGHVDLVVFHACLMAMTEVAYELKGVADYMTASQFSMPMENVLAADLWLAWLKDHLGASTQELATQIAQNVIQRAEFKQKTTHYSVVKLSEISALGAKIGNLGGVLSTEGAQHWNEVVDAWGHTNTTQLDDPKFCDLRQFASNLQGEATLGQNNLIRAATDSVIAAINHAVPFTNAYFYGSDPVVTRGGMNIHFPRTLAEFDSSNYVRLDFRATNWQTFLSNFVRNAGGGQDPTGKCCYGNNQCGVGTQAECAAVNGTWTQGADCSGQNPCGGTAPTGRCCYGNNQCGVGTQAECAAVTGTWTQGADCSGNPCGGSTQTCPTVCNQARLIQSAELVTCQFNQGSADSLQWFAFTVTQGVNYRFQLCDFPQTADYDLYLFSACDQSPFAQSWNTGCEDTTWNFNGSGTLGLAVHRYQGSGTYHMMVSQVSLDQAKHVESPISFQTSENITIGREKRGR
jgi:hypothetical protein